MTNKLSRGLAAFVLLAVAGLASHGASAYDHEVLYSFCDGSECPDGNLPLGGLLRDPSGTLYGTTTYGGTVSPAQGTIFALMPNGSSWQFQTIYSFCALTNCADGENPETGLVEDTQGNLYGTTTNGGSPGGGVVFELVPNAHHTKWKLKVLHDFCLDCADGALPNARLTYQGAASGAPYDGVSPLYGTTADGGSSGNGTIFALAPKNGGKRWSEKVIYDFCPNQDCTDGNTPGGALMVDGTGNLFANATSGGDANMGTIIELKPGKRNWTQSRLYSFCPKNGCKDGSAPAGQLLEDASGNLFGTASTGGNHGAGVLFELSPSGAGYTQNVLHSFCQEKHCDDGQTPEDGVIMDASGNLIGVASRGGQTLSGGTVFLYNGSLQVLYNFCPGSSCTDGLIPRGVPVLDSAGDIFGATDSGGAHNDGTVYELTP